MRRNDMTRRVRVWRYTHLWWFWILFTRAPARRQSEIFWKNCVSRGRLEEENIVHSDGRYIHVLKITRLTLVFKSFSFPLSTISLGVCDDQKKSIYTFRRRRKSSARTIYTIASRFLRSLFNIIIYSMRIQGVSRVAAFFYLLTIRR